MNHNKYKIKKKVAFLYNCVKIEVVNIEYKLDCYWNTGKTKFYEAISDDFV